MQLSDETVAHLLDITEAPDLSGTRYRLVSELGRGGMGVVYVAEDLELDREVAVKVLRPELGSSATEERLVREAKILAALEHPGIVPVHDVGVLPDGRVFYVMKLVRGMRLDQVARQDRSRAELFRVFIRMCEAVSFAHAHGVIHRDLKPENVMVGAFGEVLVMDWGVAKFSSAGQLSAAPSSSLERVDDPLDAAPSTGSTTSASTQELTRPSTERPTDAGASTQPGTVIGTRGYRAPEQERGDIHSIDARSDVFALGAILRAMAEIGNERPSRPVAAIVAKAMANDPSARYATANELARDAQAFLDGSPVTAYRESILERTGRALRRNRTAVTLVVGYLVMRAIVFLWLRR